MTEQKICSSCKQRITNDTGRTIFSCPSCSESTIIRCSQCRKLAVQYKCPKCGFIGPN